MGNTNTAVAPAQETKQAESKNALFALLKRNEQELMKVLPKTVTPDYAIRVCETSVRRNPDLMQCAPSSIGACLMQSAQLGLLLDNELAHAYMVPYNNKDTGQKEAQFQIGYKGYRELALRTKMYVDINAKVVYEKDDFEHSEMPRILRHVPTKDILSRGKITGVYAYAQTTAGAIIWRYLPIEDVELRRKRSKAPNSPAWKNDYVKMVQKTAIRELCGSLQLSTPILRAIQIDELREIGIMQGDNYVDVEATEIPKALPGDLDAAAAAIPTFPADAAEHYPAHDPETGEIQNEGPQHHDQAPPGSAPAASEPDDGRAAVLDNALELYDRASKEKKITTKFWSNCLDKCGVLDYQGKTALIVMQSMSGGQLEKLCVLLSEVTAAA